MSCRALRLVSACAVAVLTPAVAPSGAAAGIDLAFNAFWNARTPQAAAKVAADVVGSGATFDEALKRLQAGRRYLADVPKGVVKASHQALVRTGNTVTARTSGVAELTLLLSPSAFDLSQPVKVEANGRVVFNGRVAPSVATLLKWAARDNDRTMLFAAELHIRP